MTDDNRPEPRPAAGKDAHGIGPVGVSVIVFILGIVVGIPIANFGADVLVHYAGEVFAILFGIFVLVLLVAALVVVFRRRIWGAVFRRAEFEMHRFARPLADVARFAAEQRVAEATGAARDLAELVLARYAWVSTRRWLVATITGLIAAIAALAGSALLFQQNQLLRGQNTLLEGQTERLDQQNKLLEAQIELGEAQRAAGVVPEILEVGALLADESQKLGGETRDAGIRADELSPGLQARIVTASNMSRPYRPLNAGLVDISDEDLYRLAAGRRQDLVPPAEQASVQRAQAAATSGQLVDRIVSPERGQLIAMLQGAFVTDTAALSFRGADFSFALVRLDALRAMLLTNANLRFADFSNITINTVDFGGAYLEMARFRGASLDNVGFAALSAMDATGPYHAQQSMTVYVTRLAGADFTGAKLSNVAFGGAEMLAANLDETMLTDVDFSRAALTGATMRNALIVGASFDGADLRSVDFDGALTADADLLAHLAAAARPQSFVADRFVLEQVSRQEIEAHPRYFDIPWPETTPVYRIKRVKDFR